MRRSFSGLGIVLLALLPFAPLPASTPDSATLSASSRVVSWTGGPLLGGGGAGNCTAEVPGPVQPFGCDTFALNVAVPSSYWRAHPGGMVVRIEWAGSTSELDLSVYNARGEVVARSQFGGREFQQVVIWEPAGPYVIEVTGFAAQVLSYIGSVSLIEQRTPQAPTLASTMSFTNGLADPQLFGVGPGIWADGENGVYVSAVQGFGTLTSFLWRSDDGGRTFSVQSPRVAGALPDPRRRPCVVSEGGSDADVVSDPTGRAYFADTQDSGIATAYSEDGENWTCDPLGVTAPEVHRPWLAPAPGADGEGPAVDAYLSYTDYVIGQLPGGEFVRPDEIHVDFTRDGGATWDHGSSFGKGMLPWPGPLFSGADDALYQVFESLNGVWLARSDDGALSFALTQVSQRPGRPGGLAFLAGDVDDAGNVYAAWAESGPYDILFAASTDRGKTWSAPVRVNPPAVDTAFLPWLVAGKAGDVALAWYGAAGSFVPALAPAGTPWHVYAARTSHGAASRPAFEVGRVTETAVHFGPFGGFGEFLRVALASDGALVVSYNDDGRVDALPTDVYVAVARQVGGLGMGPSAASAASLVVLERAGDAASAPQLDLTSRPAASIAGDRMRISFTIDDAGDLAGAVEEPTATDAYWLVLWKANHRLEYAGLHIGLGGGPEFFGGDHPVGLLDPEVPTGNFAASYPAAFALEGTIDATSGVVTIEAPLGLYHLQPGDMMHHVQAFAMRGTLPQRTAHTTLDVVDATAGFSGRLGVAGLAPAEPEPAVQPAPVKRALPATGVAQNPWGVALLAVSAFGLLARRRGQPARRFGRARCPR